VIEEILRIYGYNNIETGMHVSSTLSFFEKPDREKLVNIVADMLAANGFAEIMCNSLNPAAWYEKNSDFNHEELVRLANPLSSDLNAMRLSLLHGGLTSVAWNINRQNHDLKLFEFGNIYSYKKKGGAAVDGSEVPAVDDYSERTALDIFITGSITRQSWNSKSQPGDFFSIKSWVEAVLSRLGLKPETLVSGESAKGWFAESLSWSQNGKPVAEAGRISKKYLRQFDIEQDVYYGHIEWDLLLRLAKNHRIQFTELPRYPSVRRDLALLIDSDVKFGRIREIAFKTERNILKDVSLFDVYESDSLGAGKKSYAVSFVLRDDLRTLTDKNIEKTMNNLLKAFERELNARIR
jgi:phenylalanyl-tRNA synthetase beta chain